MNLTTHENIRYLREQLGLTQEELAYKTGYKDRSSIAKIESGKVDLSATKIATFARALGVTPTQLMGLDAISFDSQTKDTNQHKESILDKALRKLLANATDEDKQMLISLLERLQDKK